MTEIVSAEELEREAEAQISMAESVRAGHIIAEREVGGPITYRMTEAGIEYVKGMGHDRPI